MHARTFSPPAAILGSVQMSLSGLFSLRLDECNYLPDFFYLLSEAKEPSYLPLCSTVSLGSVTY